MSLRWIAEFEKHPDPGSCRGVDYAAIYRSIKGCDYGVEMGGGDTSKILKVVCLTSMMGGGVVMNRIEHFH